MGVAPGARLTKLWLLTISLNCIEMNRRLLVNNDFILHSLSESKAIFRPRTYSHNLFSPVMMIT